MQTLYDYFAPKKATNLSLNSKLAKIEGKKWAKKNKRAIKAYNNFVEDHGFFSDTFREF